MAFHAAGLAHRDIKVFINDFWKKKIQKSIQIFLKIVVFFVVVFFEKTKRRKYEKTLKLIKKTFLYYQNHQGIINKDEQQGDW